METKTELQTVFDLQNVDLGTTQAHINGLAGRLDGLTAETTEGYVRVKEGIRECVALRGVVEKHRKALKRSSLDWITRVDGDAKALTALISEIESPLKMAKQIVDTEKQRLKDQKEREERQRLEAIEQTKKDELEKQEKQRLAEIKRQEESIKEENARQRAERRELDKMRRELEIKQCEIESQAKTEPEKPTVDWSQPEKLQLANPHLDDAQDRGALVAFLEDLEQLSIASRTVTEWGKKIESIIHQRLREIGVEIRIELAKPLPEDTDG